MPRRIIVLILLAINLILLGLVLLLYFMTPLRHLAFPIHLSQQTTAPAPLAQRTLAPLPAQHPAEVDALDLASDSVVLIEPRTKQLLYGRRAREPVYTNEARQIAGWAFEAAGNTTVTQPGQPGHLTPDQLNAFARASGAFNTYFQTSVESDTPALITTLYDTSVMVAAGLKTKKHSSLKPASSIQWLPLETKRLSAGWIWNDGRSLVVVLDGPVEQKERDAQKLLTYALTGIPWETVVRKHEPLFHYSVSGDEQAVSIGADTSVQLPLLSRSSIRLEPLNQARGKGSGQRKLQTPLKQGERVGTLGIYLNQQLVIRIPLVSLETITTPENRLPSDPEDRSRDTQTGRRRPPDDNHNLDTAVHRPSLDRPVAIPPAPPPVSIVRSGWR